MDRLESIEKLIEALGGKPLVTPISKVRKRRKKDRRAVARDRRIYRKKFYWEHADEMRAKQGGLKEQFFKLRRAIGSKKRAGQVGIWEWELTLDQWLTMWSECPAIEVGFNIWTPAWILRGKERDAVKLCRLDVEKAYEINNLQIIHLGRQIWPPIQEINFAE